MAVHFEWRLDSESNVYDAPFIFVHCAAQLLSWSDGTAVNKWTFDNVTVRAFGSFNLAPMTLSSILGSNDAKSVFLRVSFSPKAHSGYVNYKCASFDECAKPKYYQYAKANLRV